MCQLTRMPLHWPCPSSTHTWWRGFHWGAPTAVGILSRACCALGALRQIWKPRGNLPFSWQLGAWLLGVGLGDLQVFKKTPPGDHVALGWRCSPFPKAAVPWVSGVRCAGMLAGYLCTAVGTFSCDVRRGGVEPAPGFTWSGQCCDRWRPVKLG